MKTMEEMDRMQPDPEAIGGSLNKSGKKWVDFKFYKDMEYTLKRRNEL